MIMSHKTVASRLPKDATLSFTDFEGVAVQRHSSGKKSRAASLDNQVKSFSLLSNVFQKRDHINSHRGLEVSFSLVEPVGEKSPLPHCFMGAL